MILRKRAEEILSLVQKTEREISISDQMIVGDVYIGTGETDAVRFIARRTWNIIVAPVGKPSYVLQLIKQSGLPSTMRNFYKNAVSRIRSPPRKALILPCTGAEKLHLYEISWKLL